MELDISSAYFGAGQYMLLDRNLRSINVSFSRCIHQDPLSRAEFEADGSEEKGQS